MNEQRKPLRKSRKLTQGDKRQFLLTMGPEVIKAMKLAALEDDITASEAIEVAAKEWLDRRKSKSKKA